MKQLLVIGGSYFAGRVFVERLNRLGQYHIHVFNRGHLPLGIPGVTQITGDREVASDIATRIPNRHWDAVVDFCAYAPDVIDTMLERLPGSIGHYIFISTTAVYAPGQQFPISEQALKVDAPQPELGVFADYGYHKWLAERSLERQCRPRHIPFTILRPAVIYGRYNYAPRESSLFDHAIAETPLVVPEKAHAYYSFVWVEDMADILIACLENEAVMGQAYNVAGDEMISYAGMADIVEEVCGKKLIRQALSTDEIIRQQIPMPFPPDNHLLYDGRLLNQQLNFAHTPFILGMADTWKYYKKVCQKRMIRQKERLNA